MNKEIQSARDVQLNLAHEKFKNRGNTKKKTEQKYDKLKQEVFEKYGLQLQEAKYIRKVNPKRVFMTGSPSSVRYDGIKKKQSEVNELTHIDSHIESLIHFMRLNKSRTCIARSHSLVEILQELLIERRSVKSRIMEYKFDKYTVKSQSFLDFVNELNIKLPEEIKTNKSVSPDHNGFRNDLYHLIEFLPRFSLGLSYDLMCKLIEIEGIRNNDKLYKVNKIYR